MNRGYVIGAAVVLFLAFLLGSVIGLGVSSRVWGQTTKDLLYAYAMYEIQMAHTTLMALDEDKTDKAIGLLNMQMDSGLLTLSVHPMLSDRSSLSTNSLLMQIRARRHENPFGASRPEVRKLLDEVKSSPPDSPAHQAGSFE